MNKKFSFENIKEYHFEFKHLTVLFVVLFAFQLVLSFVNKSSIRNFLANTQEWYQKDSAERLANLTTTSLELLLETINPKRNLDDEEIRRIVQSFDIILNQHILQHNIEDLCIIVKKGDSVYAIDDGTVLFSYLFNENYYPPLTKISHTEAVRLYKNIKHEIVNKEQIYGYLTDRQTFHTFVPFVLRGEYMGAVYMRNTPDFTFITNQLISSYDETSIIYVSLILLGLLAMYFISSYTVKERDEAQQRLFEEHEENLKKQFNYEKELVFTKRIYHTHHKAEKVMGFIKEDLRNISHDNINEIKYRVTKYSNFVSRVIYDMKWYDPPLQTIRNPIFKTNINEVIKFMVDNIFLRTSNRSISFNIKLELSDKLPIVHVNEFVVWEIIEPLIQNSIEHGGDEKLIVTILTDYNEEIKQSRVIISDNGKGILPDLLEEDETGLKKIFMENITSKESPIQNVGYGCYIAHEISKRCGWEVDAENLADKGCKFTITINH
jgi:anti-sigma regulatory factor (Ser/Thr protein kinase)